MREALIIAYAYLMGSIPFGLLIAKTKGIDPRKSGSGNIGSTNVLRAVGKGAALLTLIGDIIKGMFPMALAMYFDMGTIFQGAVGITAVLGHDFSIFLRFRGGKGVATSIGVILIYLPQAGILTIMVWLVTVVITKYSSLGALVSFGLLPLTVAMSGYSTERIGVATVISVLIFIRHWKNIGRLIKGEEGKSGEKA